MAGKTPPSSPPDCVRKHPSIRVTRMNLIRPDFALADIECDGTPLGSCRINRRGSHLAISLPPGVCAGSLRPTDYHYPLLLAFNAAWIDRVWTRHGRSIGAHRLSFGRAVA